MKDARIRVAYHGHVASITLAHPPVNVIDIPMMEQLSAALAEIEARTDISAIVFRGDGKGFSAGVDIAAHTPAKIQEMLTKFHAVILALVRSKKVTIAAVHGNCLGGGAELALVSDIVYSASDAQWGFPEIELACFPPVASVALAACIGQKRAAELVLTGATFTGKDAALMGLANACGTRAEMDAKTAALIERLGRLSPAALAVTKKALYAWDAMHFDKGLARAEKIYLEELMQTDDVKEGVDAWIQKRPPKWRGK